MSNKMVLIEYTEDVESSAGRADEDEKKFTIAAGTRRRVDAASARNLTKGDGARAKLVTGDAEEDDPVITRIAGQSQSSANSPAHTSTDQSTDQSDDQGDDTAEGAD